MARTLLLVGGYGLPDRTASATRAIGLAKLFRSLGLQVIVLGKIGVDFPPPDRSSEMVVEGIRCLDIRRPFPNRDYRSYERSADAVCAVIDSLPKGEVVAVSAYNFPALGAWAIIRRCKARQVPVILDCTEWYGWEGRRIARNLLRLAGTEFRLRVLTRLAGNVICASRWFARTVTGQNQVLLPFVVDGADPKWTAADPALARPDGVRRFVYSGSPGVGMIKDRLPVAIEGFSALHDRGVAFEFIIAGMTRDQYLALRPGHAEALARLGDAVQFLGRISHERSLAIVRGADFSLFFRHLNRMTQTGFATKYVEAAALGVPVISNATSDIPVYLHDGENGFLAPGLSGQAITATLGRAARLSDDALLTMKRTCAGQNPFDIPCWQNAAADFLARLRLPA